MDTYICNSVTKIIFLAHVLLKNMYSVNKKCVQKDKLLEEGELTKHPWIEGFWHNFISLKHEIFAFFLKITDIHQSKIKVRWTHPIKSFNSVKSHGCSCNWSACCFFVFETEILRMFFSLKTRKLRESKITFYWNSPVKRLKNFLQ